VRCAKCGTESPDDARFCRACGNTLVGGEGDQGETPTRLTPEERARRLLEQAFRLSEEGRVLAAIEACQEAAALNPSSTSAHSLLGTLYERQGDRDNAIRAYEQVLALSPGSTAERRRLNELMGVPAAREGIEVSPRTARLAVTGGFVVVALVLVGAILLTLQQGPTPSPERRARAPARVAPATGWVAEPASVVPAPGRLRTLGGVSAPPPRARSWGAPARREVALAQPSAMGPGTYLVPTGGAERFPGLTSPGGVIPRQTAGPAPPVEGAVRVWSVGPTTVTTPEWAAGSAPSGAATVISPETGRRYYFQRDYRRAITAYETYLAGDPTAGAAAREELAWVYTQAGERERATQEYGTALSEYRTDLDRGHNVEASRHGVRTCESAIKALEGR
jgi:tetratricopeptide (TPR) repeat protein